MSYLPLIPVFAVIYLVTADRNVADYLYLRLLAEPLIWLRTTLFKYRLLAQLRYDRFLLKRGVVPRRFMDMAREIRPDLRDE